MAMEGKRFLDAVDYVAMMIGWRAPSSKVVVGGG
jgi:hypothetical protein